MTSFNDMFSELLELEDNMDKYTWIIDYGTESAGLSAEYCVDQNLVKGCASPLWLVKIDDKLYAQGSSSIVNGMACMICDYYNQATTQQREKFSLDELIDLGLMPLLSMGRQNGIANLIARIKTL